MESFQPRQSCHPALLPSTLCCQTKAGAVRSLMGLCLLLAALLLSRVGTPQAGTCACSEVPMAPVASAGAARAGLGLPHIPPGSTGSAWL